MIRRHAPHIRAAIMPGVAPPWVMQNQTIARDFQNMLETLFAACAADALCVENFPDFERDFYEMLSRAADGAFVTLTNPVTDSPTEILLRREELVTAIRYALHSVNLSARLPMQVDLAMNGDFAPIASILPQLLVGLANSADEGMFASVRCAEEIPFIDQEAARKAAAGTVLGTARLDAQTEICSFWPRGEIPDDFLDPLQSDVPVFMIAGEVDPATPPWMAENAIEGFSNGRLVIAANRSHWDLNDDCINRALVEFLDAASPNGVDAACAAAFSRPPFALTNEQG